MDVQDMIWVRTRITPETKQRARETAELLGWTIPGVECAAIELVFKIFTPKELADHINLTLMIANADELERQGL